MGVSLRDPCFKRFISIVNVYHIRWKSTSVFWYLAIIVLVAKGRVTPDYNIWKHARIHDHK